ncbi:MAG TPA: putative lipid II flippase FtsW [Thiobacillus sp.]|jgi:cell division protein FtsW|nr:putative lipid II flippase FtsW [Thiobacillus sp.]OYZ28149.1 MAG: putative lipid II flippase FtsW [Hydrogenophilales bacterium 16-64-40]OZA34076.1 MAG: putative lipid II flippase FtsW [Hydrogenophilales bacterium 17-64-65]HQS83061.1 putative lipid II flippase FtsW [Thiobacillus sp.]HQT33674.1 putative lipid II flippase FtsW [Thiobacillus sp.]
MLYTARAPKPRGELDFSLLWLALGLLALGLVMVYSASLAIAEAAKYTGHNGEFYLLRQGLFITLGVGVGVAAFQVPMRVWQQAAPFLFLAGLLLLVVVLIPGIGREVNGSRRWIPLGFANLQPSELMKFLAVLYAADYTTRKAAFMHDFKKSFMPMAAVMMLAGALLLSEPDFGAFVVIIAIAMGILFLGGLNWKVFAGLVVVLMIGFALLIFTSPYRMQRILGFMDPFADPYGKGYQLSHALIAFGRGEWLGQGLGGSVEKLFYLPEAHTDFLLAVIAEEFGFVGVAVVIGLFAWLIVKAFLIGHRAAQLERNFCALVAQGIGIWLGVQALINMGVNVGLLPTKGLTLPFLSFGGSGIVANCLAIAVLLRIDWEHRQMMRGKTF